MMRSRFAAVRLGLLALLAMFPLAPAAAQIVVSNLVVELRPGKDSKQDVEVWNNSPDRAYVAVEPAEVANPGTPAETRRTDPDPEKLGILVSPARMILDPGQRKLVRIAEIVPPGDRERVYRVAVKPVAGAIASDQTGLKILIGYDVLVLVRPAQPQSSISATRSGDTVTFRNDGNVSVELEEGRQCDTTGKSCSDLPGKRLYAGGQWSTQVRPGYHPEYTMKSPGQSVRKTF
jgi:P pilus assembly chaperone PapD